MPPITGLWSYLNFAAGTLAADHEFEGSSEVDPSELYSDYSADNRQSANGPIIPSLFRPDSATIIGLEGILDQTGIPVDERSAFIERMEGLVPNHRPFWQRWVATFNGSSWLSQEGLDFVEQNLSALFTDLDRAYAILVDLNPFEYPTRDQLYTAFEDAGHIYDHLGADEYCRFAMQNRYYNPSWARAMLEGGVDIFQNYAAHAWFIDVTRDDARFSQDLSFFFKPIPLVYWRIIYNAFPENGGNPESWVSTVLGVCAWIEYTRSLPTGSPLKTPQAHELYAQLYAQIRSEGGRGKIFFVNYVMENICSIVGLQNYDLDVLANFLSLVRAEPDEAEFIADIYSQEGRNDAIALVDEYLRFALTTGTLQCVVILDALQNQFGFSTSQDWLAYLNVFDLAVADLESDFAGIEAANRFLIQMETLQQVLDMQTLTLAASVRCSLGLQLDDTADIYFAAARLEATMPNLTSLQRQRILCLAVQNSYSRYELQYFVHLLRSATKNGLNSMLTLAEAGLDPHRGHIDWTVFSQEFTSRLNQNRPPVRATQTGFGIYSDTAISIRAEQIVQAVGAVSPTLAQRYVESLEQEPLPLNVRTFLTDYRYQLPSDRFISSEADAVAWVIVRDLERRSIAIPPELHAALEVKLADALQPIFHVPARDYSPRVFASTIEAGALAETGAAQREAAELRVQRSANGVRVLEATRASIPVAVPAAL